MSTLGDVIGSLLPIAAAVAISPIPISAVILLLLGPRPAGNGLGFLVGWVVGVLTPAALAAFAVTGLQETGFTGVDATVKAIALAILGTLCLWLAVRAWRKRPHEGERAHVPSWMSALDKLSPPRAALVGLAASALNPEDALLSVSAGLLVGADLASLTNMLIALAAFTVLGSITVAAPVVICLVARRKVEATLTATRRWLEQNNAVVMSVLLAIIGITLIGKAIEAL